MDLRKGGTWSRTKKLRFCYHFEVDNERSIIEFESQLVVELLVIEDVHACTFCVDHENFTGLYLHSILCAKCSHIIGGALGVLDSRCHESESQAIKERPICCMNLFGVANL
jgi:hypothetical protein